MSELSLSNHDLTHLLRDFSNKGALLRFRSRGRSMSPFLRDGDIVTIAPLRCAGPRIGDVAAFVNSHDGSLILHRVIGIQGDAYEIKGDNVRGADGLIPRSQIIGRVSRIERNGRGMRMGIGPERRAIAFISRTGLLAGLLIPALRFLRRMARGS